MDFSEGLPNARTSDSRRYLASLLLLGLLSTEALAQTFPQVDRRAVANSLQRRQSVVSTDDWDGKIPLVITNSCDSTIWPGIASQAGIGPGTGGFELEAGDKRELWVSPDWQGRVWGRTNCTVDGESCSCQTGDCFGRLDCEFSVSRDSYFYNGTCKR
jgi:hypothetical protein